MFNTLNSLKRQFPNFDFDKAFGLYLEGTTRADIQEACNITEQPLRKLFAVLNLRWYKHYRDSDYETLQLRIKNERENSDVVSDVRNRLEVLLDENHKLHKQLVRQRDINNSLRRDVRQEARNEEFESKILESLKEHIEHSVVQVPVVQLERKGGGFAIISDTHFGELSNEEETGGNYNYNIARTAMQNYVNEIIKIPTETMDVFMIGDILSGRIHESPIENGFIQSLIETEKILYEFLQTLKQNFTKVVVYWTEGNHGRISEKPSVTQKYADYEYLLIKFLESKFPDIEFNISKNGYIFTEIEGTSILATHGDRTRRLTPTNHNEVMNLQNISMKLFGKHFTNLIQGHIHQGMVVNNLYGGLNICNGSLNGTGNYTSAIGIPTQDPVQICGVVKHGQIFPKMVRVSNDSTRVS